MILVSQKRFTLLQRLRRSHVRLCDGGLRSISSDGSLRYSYEQHIGSNKTHQMFLTSQYSRAISSSSVSSSSSFQSEDVQSVLKLLEQVKDGTVNLENAASRLTLTSDKTKDVDQHVNLLSSFANIDYNRYDRTNFPEVIFAQSKTPQQVAIILDDMAGKIIQRYHLTTKQPCTPPILATRYVFSVLVPIALNYFFI
jgi:hypothetical protein